jgi:hypothetical protein
VQGLVLSGEISAITADCLLRITGRFEDRPAAEDVSLLLSVSRDHRKRVPSAAASMQVGANHGRVASCVTSTVAAPVPQTSTILGALFARKRRCLPGMHREMEPRCRPRQDPIGIGRIGDHQGDLALACVV